MQRNLTPPCSKCGKSKIIDMNAALPAMVGFQMEDGSIINLCSDCLMKLGQMNEEQKNIFFEELGVNENE